MPTPRLVAEVPEQGIRVVRTPDGDTRLLVADHGARGYPTHVLVVAVDEEDGKFFIGGDPDEPWSDRLYQATTQVPVRKQLPPYALSIGASEWPANDGTLLLLLLYFEAIAPGQAASTPETRAVNAPLAMARESGDWVAPTESLRRVERGSVGWQQIGDAIEALFKKSRVDDLRTGVIVDAAPARRLKGPASPATTFALMSCQYPCDILDHMPSGRDEVRGPADASLLRLGALLDAGDPDLAPSLLLMAGDQVYVDATAGLFDPTSQDDKYRIPYQTFFASRGPQSVLNRRDIDVRMMLDDHEIADNWEPGDEPRRPASGARSISERGKEAYWRFQRAMPRRDVLYESFDHRGLQFFVCDTRTERESRTAGDFRTRRIMSTEQFRKLGEWLEASPEAPKFVLTSSMLLPRRLSTARAGGVRSTPGDGEWDGALRSEAWDGYPASLLPLLKHVCDKNVARLVFLSGDEHLGCDAWVTVEGPGGRSVRFRSIHCPALYAPYPFANSFAADFKVPDRFEFSVGPDRYTCHVEAEFFAGSDGFVTVSSSDAGTDVRFYRGLTGPT